MFHKESIQFLKNLKKNNHKEWFEAHRSTYENARNESLALIEKILAHLSEKEAAFGELLPKQCMFRMNRDIRFSKDKSPYKTHFGLVFTPGSKKIGLAGFYLHIEPGASFAGGGIWMPEPEQLAKIRQEIDYNVKEWVGIVEKSAFKKVMGDLDQSNKLSRPPKGYEAEHPAIEYLKLKNFVCGTQIPDTVLSEKALLKETLKAFDTILPMITFLNRAIS